MKATGPAIYLVKYMIAIDDTVTIKIGETANLSSRRSHLDWYLFLEAYEAPYNKEQRLFLESYVRLKISTKYKGMVNLEGNDHFRCINKEVYCAIKNDFENIFNEAQKALDTLLTV
jgi:hypothetical protein